MNLKPPKPIRLIVVMGVSGSGKTVVGNHLANHLKVAFVDGDDLHPPENVQRMRAGVKLDDETRKPWLKAICQRAESHFDGGQSVVIACSALKLKYRTQLRSVSRPVVFVFLHGPQVLIQERMNQRKGHYMPSLLLDSQFADLEDPVGEAGVVAIKADQPLDAMLAGALEAVGSRQ